MLGDGIRAAVITVEPSSVDGRWCATDRRARITVWFEKDGEVATFHCPHPIKEAKRYLVRDARDFLKRIGVGFHADTM